MSATALTYAPPPPPVTIVGPVPGGGGAGNRGIMVPRGKPDPEGGADYPPLEIQFGDDDAFENPDHAAKVRRICEDMDGAISPVLPGRIRFECAAADPPFSGSPTLRGAPLAERIFIYSALFIIIGLMTMGLWTIVRLLGFL